MAKIGGYNVGVNQNAKPLYVILSIVMLILWLYVGDQVLGTMQEVIGCDATGLGWHGSFLGDTNYEGGCVLGTFYDTYKFLGLVSDGSGTSTSGLFSIIGIILGVSVLTQAFKITRV